MKGRSGKAASEFREPRSRRNDRKPQLTRPLLAALQQVIPRTNAGVPAKPHVSHPSKPSHLPSDAEGTMPFVLDCFSSRTRTSRWSIANKAHVARESGGVASGFLPEGEHEKAGLAPRINRQRPASPTPLGPQHSLTPFQLGVNFQRHPASA